MATIKRYRDARPPYYALVEALSVRDGGLVAGKDGAPATYVGRLVLPERAQMRIRGMLRVLKPLETSLAETLEAIDDELTETVPGPDGQQRQVVTDVAERNKRRRSAFDQPVNPEDKGDDPPAWEGVEVPALLASDVGEKALHAVGHVLPDMGALFVDDREEDEDGEPVPAPDPRSRRERRSKAK